MADNRDRILCDFPCPLHDKCRNYVEGFTKSETKHWGKSPYNEKSGTCQGFAEVRPDDKEDGVSADDIVDKVNQFLKNKNN